MGIRNLISRINTWLWDTSLPVAEGDEVTVLLPDEMDFRPWPKTARLFRDIIVTEKLDGTNAAVLIIERPCGESLVYPEDEFPEILAVVPGPVDSNTGDVEVEYWVAAQSRNRVISLEKDNQGFAKWVTLNARTLVADLGVGRHYGEFWGSKIGRGYGLDGQTVDRRFSLFNPSFFALRFTATNGGVIEPYTIETPGLGVVPVLYHGPLDTQAIGAVLQDLQDNGSQAAPGYEKPEGVIVFHTHANKIIGKVTLDNQDAGKWEL